MKPALSAVPITNFTLRWRATGKMFLSAFAWSISEYCEASRHTSGSASQSGRADRVKTAAVSRRITNSRKSRNSSSRSSTGGRSNYDAEHWRQRAKEARAVADSMNDPQSKEAMLRIAHDYERLAERAEQRTKGLP